MSITTSSRGAGLVNNPSSLSAARRVQRVMCYMNQKQNCNSKVAPNTACNTACPCRKITAVLHGDKRITRSHGYEIRSIWAARPKTVGSAHAELSPAVWRYPVALFITSSHCRALEAHDWDVDSITIGPAPTGAFRALAPRCALGARVRATAACGISCTRCKCPPKQLS